MVQICLCVLLRILPYTIHLPDQGTLNVQLCNKQPDIINRRNRKQSLNEKLNI